MNAPNGGDPRSPHRVLSRTGLASREHRFRPDVRSWTLGLALLALAAAPARAQFTSQFEVLHGFEVSPWAPYATLVQGPDGTLYGTTRYGGVGVAQGGDGGVVFRVQPDGSGFTVLHEFSATSGGGSPYASLVFGPDGALYGTAYIRIGTSDGLVFKIQTDGSGFTTLHEFSYTDGSGPYAGLVVGPDGALYGTTVGGGTYGYGVVFKIEADGSGFVRLHDFDGASEGYTPYAGLVIGPDNALHGTTWAGGAGGYGTVFRVETDGSGFEKLHDFDLTDGGSPDAALVVGPDGALYGTTYAGGTGNGGVVFKIQADGSGFTKLYEFDSSVGGASPQSALVVGPDNALYGTCPTPGGGAVWGRLFRVTADGSAFSTVFSFPDHYASGASPVAGLIVGLDNALYGATTSGGSRNGGVLYKGGGPSSRSRPMARASRSSTSSTALMALRRRVSRSGPMAPCTARRAPEARTVEGASSGSRRTARASRRCTTSPSLAPSAPVAISSSAPTGILRNHCLRWPQGRRHRVPARSAWRRRQRRYTRFFRQLRRRRQSRPGRPRRRRAGRCLRSRRRQRWSGRRLRQLPARRQPHAERPGRRLPG
jgi:uncharacterized repeat protein (TIGR03803 family)